MDGSSASVGRSTSFRKRALEERTSQDMERDSRTSKHERTLSDEVSAPSKFIATSGSNTVMDEIEAHFQRSLAQPRQSTTSTPPLTPPHPHRTPALKQTESKNVTLPFEVRENESHKIIVSLNDHTTLSQRNSQTTPTISTEPIVKPFPKSSSLKIPHSKTHPGPIPTLPMVTIPTPATSNSSNQILSPLMTPQLVQQLMAQQSLGYLQQTADDKKSAKQNTPKIKPPPLIQTSNPSKGFQIIDLTKSSQNPRAQNVVYLQKDVNGGSGLMLTTPSSVPVLPVSPMNIISNKATSLVTSTTTLPTPAVTSAFLSNPAPQVVGGIQPMVIPMVDPNNPQLISGMSGGNQVLFLSQPSLPMVQQQPLVLVNPADLAGLQQVQSGLSPGMNILSPGLSAVPGPAGGFIMLSPGPNNTTFLPPLVSVGSTPSTAHNGAPPPLKTVASKTRKPHPKAPPPLEPVARRDSLESSSPGPEDDTVMITPASVEDHFAKALGEQWSKLQTAQT